MQQPWVVVHKVADVLSQRFYEMTSNSPAKCSEEQMLSSIEPYVSIPTHIDEDSDKKMPLFQIQFQYEDNQEPNISTSQFSTYQEFQRKIPLRQNMALSKQLLPL